jgi:hypothetical protein
MGLNYNDVRCLMEWRGTARGGAVVTLGRLNLTLHPKDLSDLRRKLSNDGSALAWVGRYQWGDFADDMLREVFKFDSITSIDFSAYEGANVVQDIGAALRPDLVGQFDLAIDGGTLEHVFNFPVAVGNLMRLAKVGGAVYTQNPCNGLAGHGFYQFSPELMYRVFSEPNGFEVSFVRIAMAHSLSVERTTGQQVYDVMDPAKFGGRVYLTSRNPVILMSLAVRVSDVEPFTTSVLQSDYIEKWSASDGPRLNWKGRLVEAIGRAMPFVPALIARHENNKAYTRLW